MGEGGATSPVRLWLALGSLGMAWWMYQADNEVDMGVTALGTPIYSRMDLDAFSANNAGKNGSLLLTIFGRVFNVTSGEEFYRKGQSYDVYPGHDCSYCFAVSKVSRKCLDKGLDLPKITESALLGLNDTYWSTYVTKYPIVGVLADPPYEPSKYDYLAGPFAEVRTTQATPGPRKRQSRCPVTRAARAIGGAIIDLLPRGLLGPPAPASGS
mmetsp:Transcript_46032/g.99971  ORF Transcript_46032/g.99971 Transcript_46032/m.99971 type:complete len:212 (-) Transcript_46032:196-831(-)